MSANYLNHTFIRSLFVPIQPAESQSDGWLLHRSFTPPPALASYIHSFWEMKGTVYFTETYPYSLVPDGSADLLFSLHPDEPGGYLSVTDSAASIIDLQGDVHYLGVRFLPGCLLKFFPFSFHVLKGQTFALNDVFGNWVKEWEEKILEAGSIEDSITFLSNLLLHRLSSQIFETDPRFLHALYLILQSEGNARIETEVADFTSPRNLRRIFEHHTSLTPKSFSRVIRFQKTLGLMQQMSKADGNRAFPDCGYFDQAHFIKEFKMFTGYTPTNML